MIRLFLQTFRKMSLKPCVTSREMEKSYEEAVCALNTLQSSATTLAKTKYERDMKRYQYIPDTLNAAEVIGITPERLDQLSVIHVSGTKGKGSTCALCESILRAHGFTTGFFSSPHLVEVRERIRVNGRPLSRDAYSNYFWNCFNKLEAAKDRQGFVMPFYFRFLTIMALEVFLQEKVDVVILEVGVGGEYDCTNIIRSPVVCGVSSLGIDHTNILGSTIDQIAWHKAGIFKPNVPALTISQPDKSIEVLKSRAKEIGCPLFVVPDLTQYDWGGQEVTLGIPGVMQTVNASLALQLAHVWIQDHNLSLSDRIKKYFTHEKGSVAQTFPITRQLRAGLELCRWAGRSQRVHKERLTYYIDGAHTTRSMQACVTWFIRAANAEKNKIRGRVARVLMFDLNSGRGRCVQELLILLLPCAFDCAIFCPSIASVASVKADQQKMAVTTDDILAKSIEYKNTWLKVFSTYSPDKNSNLPIPNVRGADLQRTLASHNDNIPGEVDVVNHLVSTKQSVEQDVDSGFESGDSLSSSPERDIIPSYVFNTIQDGLTWMTQGRDPALDGISPPVAVVPQVLREADHIQVLVTGSFHLVGGLLGLIDPDMND